MSWLKGHPSLKQNSCVEMYFEFEELQGNASCKKVGLRKE